MPRYLKSLIKSGATGLLSHSMVCRLFDPVMNYQATIFLLHRMADPDRGVEGYSPELLDAALRYLKKAGYNLVSLEDLIDSLNGERAPIEKAVAFTMDDGFLDQAEAASIFVRHDCPLTMFLITGFIDGELWPWDDRIRHAFLTTERTEITTTFRGIEQSFDLSTPEKRREASKQFRDQCKLVSDTDLYEAIDALYHAAGLVPSLTPPPNYAPMTWDMARGLEEQGVRFAPHSTSHVVMSRLSRDKQIHEIEHSWRRLNEELSDPVPVFSFPTGRSIDYDSRVIRLLQERGFKGAVSSDSGHVDLAGPAEGYERYELKRFSFPDNLDDLKQYCTWIEWAKEKVRQTAPSLNNGNTITKRSIASSYLGHMQWIAGRLRKYEEIDWSSVRRLIFVCKGNICRSPYAEARAAALGLEAISFGIDAMPGSKADQDAVRNAYLRGLNLIEHRSKTLENITIESGDLFVGMEWGHAEFIIQRSPPTDTQVTLLGLWSAKPNPHIVDPFGGTDDHFKDCFEAIDIALNELEKKVAVNT